MSTRCHDSGTDLPSYSRYDAKGKPSLCDWCHGFDDGVRMVLEMIPSDTREALLARGEAFRNAWSRGEAKT